MDSDKLRVFLKAVETGSFSAAGEQLGFTQAGVSYIIKALEGELGAQLLIRGKQGVRLTSAGSALFPSIRAAVEAMDELENAARSLKAPEAPRLKIGTLHSLSIAWLPSIISEFCRAFPDVQIDVQEAGTDKLGEMLSTGEADFVFSSAAPRSTEWIPLASDRLLAIMHSEHRFAEETQIPLKILAKEPFIMPAAGFDNDVERLFQKSGIRPNVIFTSMDDYAIVSMVQHGIGVSVVPEMILARSRDGLAIKELAPIQYRSLGIALPSLSGASSAAKAFIDCALRIVPNLAASTNANF